MATPTNTTEILKTAAAQVADTHPEVILIQHKAFLQEFLDELSANATELNSQKNSAVAANMSFRLEELDVQSGHVSDAIEETVDKLNQVDYCLRQLESGETL